MTGSYLAFLAKWAVIARYSHGSAAGAAAPYAASKMMISRPLISSRHESGRNRRTVASSAAETSRSMARASDTWPLTDSRTSMEVVGHAAAPRYAEGWPWTAVPRPP